MRKLIPWSLSLSLCMAAAPAFSATTVVEEIVARVNNRIVTLTDFQHSQEETRQEAQQQDAANAEKIYKEHEKDILRDLIDHQLLLEKAADLGITGDTEVIKWLDQMRKDMKLDTMEDLEKAATAQGINFEDFKQNKKNEIIMQQVIGHEVGSRIGDSISNQDKLNYYEQHKSELQHPEQVRLSEILVVPAKEDVDPKVSPDNPESHPAAYARANDLLAQIKKGAAFDDIAKKNSQGPTAAQGGDLGDFQRGTLNKSLEDKVFAMKAGDVSDATLTKQGFVILKVTDHQPAGIPSYKDVEPRSRTPFTWKSCNPRWRVPGPPARGCLHKIGGRLCGQRRDPQRNHAGSDQPGRGKAKKLAKKKKKLGIL